MEDVLRVAVCDDKTEDLKQIEAAFRKCMGELIDGERVACFLFQSGETMYDADRKAPFDLVILDVEMPGVGGFDLAGRIGNSNRDVHVIFVSNHENFVWDSQKYMPLWFVRKSKLETDMADAVRQYREVTRTRRASYPFREGELYLRDILYIESEGHSLMIRKINGGVMRQYGSLKAMEEKLVAYHFLRIHKSFLVNPQYIEEIGRREIRLKNGMLLEMGRDRRKSVQREMQEYRNKL